MAKLEKAKWTGPRRGRQCSESVKLLRSIKVGSVKRLTHDDVICKKGAGSRRVCSLWQELHRLRKLGRDIEAYHVADHVAVFRRTK